MSSKITIDQLAQIIKHNQIEPAVARRIIEEANALAEVKETDTPAAGPKPKQQFVIVVSDPTKQIKQDLVGWVTQIGEAESPATVMERLNRAAHDFNASKKGRMVPVNTVGEAFENVPRKFLKEAGLHTKTKVPVLVVTTDNKLTEAPSV